MKPYRSILSVPGHIQKMHTKAAESAADVIMLDLEDSVPQEAKEDGRMQVLTSLQTIDWQQKTVSIRINGLDTPYAYRDLLVIVEGAGEKVHSIVLPKVIRAISISSNGCWTGLNRPDNCPKACSFELLSVSYSDKKSSLRYSIASPANMASPRLHVNQQFIDSLTPHIESGSVNLDICWNYQAYAVWP